MDEQKQNIQQSSTKEPESNSTKSLKGYLFEFILLFLAVFLGFVAENFRESLSEQEQAEELAHNFYDELLTDSIAIRWYIDARFTKDAALIAVKNYVLDSSLEKVSTNFVRNYYLSFFLNNHFEPTDIVLEQLKNSGSLRYFKNKELQRLTGGLSACIARMRQFDEYDADFLQSQIMPFHVEHGDQTFHDKITHDGKLTFSRFVEILANDTVKESYHFHNLPTFDRKKFNNVIGLYRSRLKVATSHHYLTYVNINKELLAVLRKEYHIK